MDPRSQMMKLVVGILGNIIGVGVNLAPMPTFWKIYRNKCTQGFSGLPYVFALVSALLWVLYGLPMVTEHALLLITINATSSSIQIFYVAVFLTYAAKKPRIHVMKVMAVCFSLLAVAAVLTVTVVPRYQRSRTVGSIGIVIGVMTYASPLSVARMVIRTRSVEFLPILLCIFFFVNSIVWTCYGLITHDIFVLTPNGIGVVFGVTQIALYAMYRNAKQLDEFPKESKHGDDIVIPVPLEIDFVKSPLYTPNRKPVKSDGNLKAASLPSQDTSNGHLPVINGHLPVINGHLPVVTSNGHLPVVTSNGHLPV